MTIAEMYNDELNKGFFIEEMPRSFELYNTVASYMGDYQDQLCGSVYICKDGQTKKDAYLKIPRSYDKDDFPEVFDMCYVDSLTRYKPVETKRSGRDIVIKVEPVPKEENYDDEY